MPPEFTLFLDENHHRTKAILRVLTEADIRFERHEDHFASGTPDEEWLPQIGAYGWFLLTSDTRIRHRHSERRQIMEACIGLFCFSSNNQPASEMAAALKAALPSMRDIANKTVRPFVATIEKTGRVNLRHLN